MHCTMLTHAWARVEDGRHSDATVGCSACSSELCSLAACDLRPSGTSHQCVLHGPVICRVWKNTRTDIYSLLYVWTSRCGIDNLNVLALPPRLLRCAACRDPLYALRPLEEGCAPCELVVFDAAVAGGRAEGRSSGVY